MNIPRLVHEQYGERFDLVPSFGRYGNGRLAFQLYTHEGEPFATISLNMPGDQLYTDSEMFVKWYAENDLIVQTLLREGWLERTGRKTRTGYVEVPVMNLAGPLLEWYDSLSDEEVNLNE
jgi:hypothetical protein